MNSPGAAHGVLCVDHRVGNGDDGAVLVGRRSHWLSALRGSAAEFHRAKRVAIVALTLSLLMWLVAFLSVGGEWFLMWQSKTWNGQDAAFRMFTVVGIVLLLVAQPDQEQPTLILVCAARAILRRRSASKNHSKPTVK